MRIDSLRIRGFGTLSDREFTFGPGRAAIVAEPNESGKTALVQAIIAALYGLPKQRASKNNVPLRTIYDPWDGGAFGVEATVSVHDRQVHLIHDFRTGRFQAKDLTSGADLTDDLTDEPSREWLEIGGDDFRRIACVSGKEQAALSESSEIVARLEELLSGSDVAADSARRNIEAALQKVPGHEGRSLQIRTAINRASEALEAARLRVDSLVQERSDRAAALDELEELRAKLPALEAAVGDARAAGARARLAEISERLTAHQNAAAEVSRLEKEAAALGGLEEFPEGDEQRAASLSASIQAASERAGQLGAEREQARESLRQTAAGLEAMGRLSNVTREQVDELQSLAVLAQKAEERLAAAETAAAESVSRLPGGPGHAETLLGAFEEASPQHQQALAAYMDNEAVWSPERTKLQAERDGMAAALGAMRPSSGALWAIAAVLAVVAGGLTGAGYLPAAAAVALLTLIVGWRAFAGGRAERGLRARGEALDARLRDGQLRADELRTAARSAAAALGFGDLDQACQARRQWQAVRPDLLRWRSLREAVRADREESAALRQRATQVAANYGLVLDPSAPVSGQLADLLKQASAAIDARDNLDRLERGLKELETSADQAQQKQTELSAQLALILRAAGISSDIANEEAMEQFSRRAAQARRLRVIRADLLPAARARLLPEDEHARLSEERGKLEPDVQNASRDAALPPVEANARLENARTALNQTRGRIQELSLGLWETLTRVRHELPAAEDDVLRLEEYLARAHRFQQAADIALEALAQAGSEARKLWSGWLNDTVTDLLERLDLRWSQALFAEDLTFSLYDRKRGAWLDAQQAGAHLSTGAKDQVWLACRLGICRALSREEPLPLLLDDPFLTWDDERFERGMRLFGDELLAGNQIIIVTCHEGRHRRLREENPEWFDSRFSFVDL
jgi:DNA repair exonuclease SbcCD ATPase subunit